ncbi:MAG: peptidylprolyl isomerase, partial [Planctomycetota bacterium]
VVLLGAALFAIHATLSERTTQAGAGTIVVSEGRIENLSALFAKTWQRPPTAAELRGLVDDYVLEEALYREGVALGVDQNDTIIRRRVRQKMEFVVNDIAELLEATEEQLAEWLAAHPASYARPARFRFRQLYLNPDLRGDSLQADATSILAQLRAADASFDPRLLGDVSLLEHAYPEVAADVVGRTFGEDFAQRLAEVSAGEWAGPLESAFGLHLVFIDAYTAGEVPDLDLVRAEVLRDWKYAQREATSDRFYRSLLARYDISIDWPAVMGEDQN